MAESSPLGMSYLAEKSSLETGKRVYLAHDIIIGADRDPMAGLKDEGDLRNLSGSWRAEGPALRGAANDDRTQHEP